MRDGGKRDEGLFYYLMKLGEGAQKGSYPFSVNDVTLLSASPGLSGDGLLGYDVVLFDASVN